MYAETEADDLSAEPEGLSGLAHAATTVIAEMTA
jgi:hypothetical protein